MYKVNAWIYIRQKDIGRLPSEEIARIISVYRDKLDFINVVFLLKSAEVLTPHNVRMNVDIFYNASLRSLSKAINDVDNLAVTFTGVPETVRLDPFKAKGGGLDERY